MIITIYEARLIQSLPSHLFLPFVEQTSNQGRHNYLIYACSYPSNVVTPDRISITDIKNNPRYKQVL